MNLNDKEYKSQKVQRNLALLSPADIYAIIQHSLKLRDKAIDSGQSSSVIEKWGNIYLEAYREFDHRIKKIFEL